MDNSFKKIKQKCLLLAIIKSSLVGVAAALAAVGGVLLGLKLAETQINFLWYILIGVGVAAAVGGLLLLLLRPTDKKVAKRLDREYALSEKIQTMVEYADKDDDMVVLQRNDAEEKLQELPRRKVKLAKIWHYAVIPVLALALFVTGVALPYKGEEPVYVPPFGYTERQREAVRQLIADVEKSNLSSENKLTTKTALGNLSATLETVTTVPEMKSAVISSVRLIDSVLYTANSFDNATAALESNQNDDVNKLLASAISDGVNKFITSSTRITSYEQVEAAESTLEDVIGGAAGAKFDEIKAMFEVNVADGVAEILTDASGQITDGIKNLDAEDFITVALASFARTLEEVCAGIESGISDVNVQNRLAVSLNALKSELLETLIPQTLNCLMDEYVRIRLATIFGLALTELPPLLSGVQGDNGSTYDPPSDDDNPTNSGGYGKGDNIYGGNDPIYHPQTGEMSPYGDYLEEYYSKAMELMENEDIPENVKKYIEEYFNILYRGIQNSEEKNEVE